MIKINLITMGDIKEQYLRDAINEYKKRLTRFCELNIIEIKESVAKTNNKADILQALKKDAEQIRKHMKGHTICLDIVGDMLSSEDLAKKVQSLCLKTSEISFIIGASNGIEEELKRECKDRISFSKMTFPHQLMRVIFLEQLYRSFTIINNISYHK